jgi:hypothetical protein
MVIYPLISLDTNPINLWILLRSTTKSYYQLITSDPLFSLQSIATRPPIELLSVELFYLMSMYSNYPLPDRVTLKFELLSMS